MWKKYFYILSWRCNTCDSSLIRGVLLEAMHVEPCLIEVTQIWKVVSTVAVNVFLAVPPLFNRLLEAHLFAAHWTAWHSL